MEIFKLNMRFFACVLSLLFCIGIGLGRRSNETDELSLLAFKARITHDPLGIMSSWKNSLHFCQWYGVTCNNQTQRVTTLDLNSQLLQGSISPHLGNLSFLRILNLENNSFSLEIPPEIGYLRKLEVLALDINLLTGEIPENISACSNLIIMNLGYNKLTGRIPTAFNLLTKLRYILVDFNNLTGTIPSFFGNFSDLLMLQTTVNSFEGTIPESLGRLKRLYYLSMGGNFLSGTIPPSLCNLSSISVFCFPENQLEGTIPPELGNNFPNLHEFNVGDNRFTGAIPASVSNASNLERFTIAINNISGNMPSLEKLHKLWWLSISTNKLGTGGAGDLNFLSTVSNLTSLKLVALGNNNFGGSLPGSVTNFTSLSILTMESNQLSGRIPGGLGNLINLEMLYMEANQFSSEIPEEIGKLQQLKELSLSNNKFSGRIPSSLGNLTLLTQLHLQNNSLSGIIPSSIGRCQNLQSLRLNYNNLSGSIPKEVVSISSLTIYLGLSQNYLTGSLPTEVRALKNLGIFSVSNNMLSGKIPSSLGECESLQFLYLQGNSFQGSVPQSLSSLKGIQELDLSHNNLTGKIPNFFTSFSSLVRLNLSYNELEGMVPEEGVFKNSTKISLTGNKLCGGIAELGLPSCPVQQTKNKLSALAIALIISASCVVCVLVLVYSFLLLFKRKNVKLNPRDSEISELRVSYQSLIKATDGFSTKNLLGVGSYGSVYKGTLSGTEIAVKVLNLMNPGAFKSFKAECEILKNVRHRNLVKLITACSGVDYNGNDFKALVYEYLVFGSLDEWLHPGDSIIPDDEHLLPRKLTLIQRINIAIDVAHALDYLHHGCQTPIVHCDLKPSNILLNGNMTAHVGDFGLSKFFSETFYSYSSNQSSTIAVRGTIGYTAPEYGMGNDVTTYGDAYSYGIMLLEMFTRKRPTDEMFRDGLNLRDYVKAVSA